MISNVLCFNRREWVLRDLPDLIMIESVMGCNLRCGMCPVPQSKTTMNGRAHAVMSPETFRRVLDGISDRPHSIFLNQMGEPLLNKSICEFVALAKAAGHTVAITTNGTLMREDVARGLLSAGIDHVTFSVDGFTAKTYESIRVGADYERVRANIEMFCRLRDDLNKATYIQIDCILSDLTKSEIPLMKSYWKSKVDCFRVIPLDDWSGKLELPKMFGLRNWAAKVSGGGRYPCDLLWTTMAISAEGCVMYCCHDYKLTSGLENVNEMPLKEIWARGLSEERRKHAQGLIDKEPCLHCVAWKTRQPAFSQLHILANLLSVKQRFLLQKVRQSLART